MINIRKVETFVFRVPVERPVRSAVGSYDNRPGVLVRIEDTEGFCGWGEVFCNFPPCGAEHRARIIDTMLGPLLIGHPKFSRPEEAYIYLSQKMAIIILKSGEFGPFAQCIAAIDIALWDLWARREKYPIWKLLNQNGNPQVKVYSSGLGPDAPEEAAVVKQQEGYRAFKLKVGFDLEFDLRNLKALREALGSDAIIMVDANQVWNLDQAISRAMDFAKYDLHWIEEPIRCDRPIQEWQQLAETSPISLAAGENLRSEEEFKGVIEMGIIKFLQPDIIKWGGFSGLLPIINYSDRAGLVYCPHSLAGGVGLIASAHLLATSRNPGWLEIDSNENPLRTYIIDPFPEIIDGTLSLPDEPGLGWVPDMQAVYEFRVDY